MVKIMADNFKNLATLGKNLKDLSGTTSVPLTDIYSDTFFQKHTPFQSFQDFLEKGGFTVNSQEDLDNISDEDLNKFTNENTNFESFEKLQELAVAEFTRQLLFKNFK